MNRIFEVTYPDKGGYHFYSVYVWQGMARRHEEETGWQNLHFRILEARMVIRGQLKHHVYNVAMEDSGTWDSILEYAKQLGEGWLSTFSHESKLAEGNIS